ncbi:MAG: COX15/CtaA family protein [Bacillus sp. (in: firmicutes)]
MTKKHLALVAVLLTYFLIVFGGYVASSNSGMGCGPEWPMCNGEVVPTLKGATLIEYLHRVIGAILGVISILLFFTLIKKGRRVSLVGNSMLVLLVIQVLLGAVVVVRDLPSGIISIHLLIAMIFLACLIWIWRYLTLEERANQLFVTEGKQKTVIMHLNTLLVLLLATLAFGAYIKHQSYGLACGWFGCRQSFLPSSIPELLQTVHRALAIVSTLYICVLAYWSFKKRWGTGLQKRLLLSMLIVILQLIIGVAVVMSYINISVAVLHLAIGTGIFALVSEARVYVGSAMIKSDRSAVLNRGWHNDRRSLDD